MREYLAQLEAAVDQVAYSNLPDATKELLLSLIEKEVRDVKQDFDLLVSSSATEH